MSTNASKMTWQRFVAILFALPVLFITLAHWGYSLGKEDMSMGFSTAVETILCALCGLLTGIMFVTPGEAFGKNLVPRAVAGLISGALSIWAFGGYLYLRSFPESIYRIEIALAALLAMLPGLILYKIMAKH